MSDKYLNDYVEGSLEKLCWNFCANCEMPIFSAEKYIMYEGLCKKCYYQRVYQEGLSPEQIDWLQPAENDDDLYDIKMLNTLDNYREKNKPYNER